MKPFKKYREAKRNKSLLTLPFRYNMSKFCCESLKIFLIETFLWVCYTKVHIKIYFCANK